MKILLTGIAGFIGFHTAKKLAENDIKVFGIDNLNSYYDINLKYSRLKDLGINTENCIDLENGIVSSIHTNLFFKKIDITDVESLKNIFLNNKFDLVLHLAAQAGVRYSIENPKAYIDSNIIGFSNILECIREFKIKKLIYASSSSVYGNNTEIPFRISHKVDEPVSLYAATKKSNELMAYSYSNLYGISTIGLRFFTVYGPWGRPDMAMFLFTDAILNDKPIKVFNNGLLERDFTYISDIIDGLACIVKDMKDDGISKLYNIGNGSPVKLLDFINLIESNLGLKAKKRFLPMQKGDVVITYADTSNLFKDFNYKPKIKIDVGVNEFIKWYLNIYKKLK